ncbi:MAG: hypothetical protein AABW99_00045 [archaeon]
MPMNKHALALFFSVLAASICFAQVAVVIEPSGGTANPVYPFEAKEYRLTVVNLSGAEARNVDVLLFAPKEAALVVNGSDEIERLFTFVSLGAGQQQERIFQVRPLAFSEAPLEIKAVYGDENAPNSASAFLQVLKPVVSFNASLSKDSFSPNEQGKIMFSVSNDSGQETLFGVKAEAFATGSITNISPPLVVGLLEPGKGIPESSFSFTTGKRPERDFLALRLSYSDSLGSHALEKSFRVESRDRDYSAALFVGAIIVLVLVSFYFSRKRMADEKKGAAKDAALHPDSK